MLGGSVGAGFMYWVYIGGFMIWVYELNIGLKRHKTRFEALFHIVASLYAWGALML